MKKVSIFIIAVLFSLSSYAVDKEKVAKANLQTIDAMLNYVLALNNTPGATGDMNNGSLVSFAFSQIGYELPSDLTSLYNVGTPVKKQTKLQIGDLIFFNDNQFGIVYKVNGDNTVSFLHIADGKVLVSSSTGLKYAKGQHITSDSELKTLRKEYESEQKAIAKAKANAEKAQKKAEAERAKAEKAKADAEKAATKAQAKIDKANAEAEKAAAKAEKANQKRDNLMNVSE